jgi:PPOX class probable F420-dependent enzyme
VLGETGLECDDQATAPARRTGARTRRREDAMLDLASEFGRHADERLRGEIVCWLTTIRPDGTPVPIPVWFLWDGATIVIYSQPRTGKLRNLEHSPRAAINLNSSPDGDDVLVLRGEAHEDRTIPPADALPEYLAKYREAISGIGMTPESFAADYSVPIRFTPEKITGF